ncbi:MAG: hypothetical protein C5B43_03800 [Verrucomicrobia bacterium]|nr:MAG: hypothetical protein C5B43_03800 [Verrucomicrobiota bacterium]
MNKIKLSNKGLGNNNQSRVCSENSEIKYKNQGRERLYQNRSIEAVNTDNKFSNTQNRANLKSNTPKVALQDRKVYKLRPRMDVEKKAKVDNSKKELVNGDAKRKITSIEKRDLARGKLEKSNEQKFSFRDVTNIKCEVQTEKRSKKRLFVDEPEQMDKEIINKRRSVDTSEPKGNVKEVNNNRKVSKSSSEKRKDTIKDKLKTSQEVEPFREIGNTLEFQYRHTKSSEIELKVAKGFDKSLKEEINTHIGNKEVPFGSCLDLYFTSETPISPIKGTQLPRKVFVLMKGHDVVVTPTYTENDVAVPARIDSPYSDLAKNADGIVKNMVARSEMTIEEARKRVARDIQRVGGGLEIKGSYTRDEWRDLAEFGAVIRLDKGRAPNATWYVDSILMKNEHSFCERFAGRKPMYKGTGKGTVEINEKMHVRGAKALREIALTKEDGNGTILNATDYGSDLDEEEDIDIGAILGEIEEMDV